MPKLSIITINYNHLDGLKRTVESVINLTWQEFEYLVIDGGFVFNYKNVNILTLIV
jgi:glycosyltransferase involved in cell wall biosynthesis